MRLTRRVHLIASGALGCSLTHPLDCNAYALFCGDGFLMIDTGVGVEPERMVQVLNDDGIKPDEFRGILLTHAHLDHAGGAYAFHATGQVPVTASIEAARALENGNEEAISLSAAKRAGIYPHSYQFRACPVDRPLDGGESWSIGDVTIRAIRTPGHSDDMLSYVAETPDQLIAFPGDTVFHGGRVLLQGTPDCRPAALIQSLQILGRYEIDGLYPGHGMWSVRDGYKQVEAARAYTDRLLVPPNLF